MPKSKSKVAKVDFSTYFHQLEQADRSVDVYRQALQNVDVSLPPFRELSINEQFGVLVSKFGFLEVSRVSTAVKASAFVSFSPRILSETLDADVELCEFIIDYSHSMHSNPESSEYFLLPPCSLCILCNSELHKCHQPVSVKVATLNGIKKGHKATLRCRKCNLMYKYHSYGNSSINFKLYDKKQPLIEASDILYVERQLLELQCTLANHSWVSFVGFAESFNDAFGLTRHTGISAKHVSSAFYNGEMESELRELGRLDMFGLMKVDSDRDKIMEHIESVRRQKPYPHPVCHPSCEARGCGRVFVADGIWKLSFPHCMHKCENKVSGIPVPSLPDVCTKPPLRGKAFCAAHCEEARSSEIPTGLHEFLKHCGVKTADQSAAGPSVSTECRSDSTDNFGLTSDAGCNERVISGVGDVLAKLKPTPSTGESLVDAQGTVNFLNKHSATMSTMMTECVEEVPSSCKKDTGARKRLQKWSRGHLFVVRAGGHIEFWQTLYKSESPSQVFLILATWLFSFLSTVPQTSWSDIAIVYDNMCHLDNMIVARKPLPLPWPWSHMWLNLHKCVDRLHIRNHTDESCLTKYHPNDHLADTDNTLSAEQTFVWLARFKKILCAMPKVHHLFYLHRMVVRRNRYTASCYSNGYNPMLPVVKSSSTT